MRTWFLVFLAIVLTSPIASDEYTLTVYVHARHLDYSNLLGLCESIVSHPAFGGYRGDVGHAWIRLRALQNERESVWEGGHSGELGQRQPKYFDGIMRMLNAGHPNPVSYLWTTLHDGFLQRGSGGHIPTYSVSFRITQEQHEAIVRFVRSYRYSEYSLTGNQCASFVAQAAALAGIQLEHQLTMDIAPTLRFRGRCMCLWRDPRYSRITFSTPDVLEGSLRAVKGLVSKH